MENQAERLEHLTATAIALSSEASATRLLEEILAGAMKITRADAGTLYLKTSEHTLRFELMRNISLGIARGGFGQQPIGLDPLPLYETDGTPNNRMVAACAALRERTITIPDVYASDAFDFSGTRAYDRTTGYRSRAFLTVPMKNHTREIIGVLQLINPLDLEGRHSCFSTEDQKLVESLASLAAVTLNKQQLLDDQKLLFESFIRLIAHAIDAKSAHTGKHCERVPVVAMLLAEALCETRVGKFKDYRFSEDELYELKIAAWLHDCGKITTPEHVINKSTKLETILDRIELVDTRFEVLKRDALIELLEGRIDALESGRTPNATGWETTRYRRRLRRLEEDRLHLHKNNIGGESMASADKERVREIAAQRWTGSDGQQRCLLTEDEVYNLIVDKGTLNREEREIIHDHIRVTIRMLEALPYPKHLRQVPEIAGAHHEHVDGTGYPRRLAGEQMSVRARIMAIADVFEALTAADRPYKCAKPLSETLRIMEQMTLDGKLDSDIFALFVEQQVYLRYAEHYLRPEQIDVSNYDATFSSGW